MTGIQVGNIAAVESSSRIPCLPVGTQSSLEQTKSRTTPTRSGTHRGRPRVGGRKNVNREIISYTGKVQGRNQTMKELVDIVKWKPCVEDDNTWEPPEGMKNAQEVMERFDTESPEMPGQGEVE